MTAFIVRRVIYMALVVVLLSLVSFMVIQLPPGDYLTTYIEQLIMSGAVVDEAEVASLRDTYGLHLSRSASTCAGCAASCAAISACHSNGTGRSAN